MTLLIWRLTYSMCIFGRQLGRYLNLAWDLQMSRLISLCSLWNDVIMVGEMTVVSIMHKVRVCGRHLCKSGSPHGWWQWNKWNCSYQSAGFRWVPAIQAPGKSLNKKKKKNKEQTLKKLWLWLAVSEIPIIFRSHDTHYRHFDGQLMHKNWHKKEISGLTSLCELMQR